MGKRKNKCKIATKKNHELGCGLLCDHIYALICEIVFQT